MILFIKHIDIEGPGTIETHFKKMGCPTKTLNLHKGDRFLKDFSQIDAVVSLGGPMSVYEEDKFPFLKEEDRYLRTIIQEEIPYLGICLGSQLLAKACGAKVTRSPVKEIGWFKAQLKPEGKTDPLFLGVGDEIDVYHWHEDMWEVPQEGRLLATGDGCPHQSFKIGKNAYGLQFHIEVTDRIIKDWCKNYFKSDDPVLNQKAKDMVETFGKKRNDFEQTARKIYDNFARIMADRWAPI